MHILVSHSLDVITNSSQSDRRIRRTSNNQIFTTSPQVSLPPRSPRVQQYRCRIIRQCTLSLDHSSDHRHHRFRVRRPLRARLPASKGELNDRTRLVRLKRRGVIDLYEKKSMRLGSNRTRDSWASTETLNCTGRFAHKYIYMIFLTWTFYVSPPLHQCCSFPKAVRYVHPIQKKSETYPRMNGQRPLPAVTSPLLLPQILDGERVEAGCRRLRRPVLQRGRSSLREFTRIGYCLLKKYYICS